MIFEANELQKNMFQIKFVGVGFKKILLNSYFFFQRKIVGYHFFFLKKSEDKKAKYGSNVIGILLYPSCESKSFVSKL